MPINEAELIEKEITIRNLRLTKEVLETRRSTVRWLALTLGILNPGESRLSSIAVLDALVQYQFVKNMDPTVDDLMAYINANWESINEKTLRYHLLRMKKAGLVENSGGKFYFKQPSVGDRFDPSTWAASVFESDYREIAGKIGEAIKELKSKGSMNAARE